ncbi:MAG: hypothetical protein JRG91_14050 [Deltaproteobacteria bacterium]|nr:hypothetical protein [Deltaproteobacteria bacterium]
MAHSSWKTVTLACFLAVAAQACSNDLAKADELLATGDPEGAAAIYQARIDKSPGDGAGTIGLARALYTSALEKAKSDQDTAGEWNKVVEAMEAAIIIDPAPEGVAPVDEALLSDSLYRAGMKRFEAKDWPGTVQALEKAVDKGKKTDEVYATLARAHHEAGSTEDALKAAKKAAKLNERSVELFREAAGWASASQLPWMHHHFFYLAEQQKPVGYKFMAPTQISKKLTQRYPAFNMVNDTMGLFLYNAEVDNLAWDGLTKEREPLIADMDKFISKKPPAAFAAADRSRLHWMVYHYWNTMGVVFIYLGANDKAREWWGKANEVADSGKVKHPDFSKEELADQTKWVEENLAILK